MARVRPKGSVKGDPSKFSTLDVHRALFPDGPPTRRTLAELKEGIRRRVLAKFEKG